MITEKEGTTGGNYKINSLGCGVDKNTVIHVYKLTMRVSQGAVSLRSFKWTKTVFIYRCTD